MIFPSKCLIFTRLVYDKFGQPSFDLQVTEKCAIVKITSQQQHTSVRADQTASRGHGDEFVAATTLLMVPKTVLKINDRLDIGGIKFRTKSLHQRYSVTGALDHIEAGFELWV